MPYVGPRELAERRQKSSARKPQIFPRFPNWQKCCDHFLRSLEARSGSVGTRTTYEGTLRAFFQDGKRPDKYTQAEVLDFIDSPTNSPRSRGKPPMPGTRNNRLVRLKSFYGFAGSYEISFRGGFRPLCQRDPTRGIDLIAEGEVYKGMEMHEIQAFFAAIPRDTPVGLRDFALFSFFWWSARRLNEVVRLRSCDIEPWVFENGHAGWRYHFTGKGKSRTRDAAELHPSAWDALSAYWCATDRLPLPSNAPLFAATKTSDRHRPLSARAVDQRFHTYARLAGIEGRGYTVHSFRWSAAYERFRRNGYNIVKIKELLRHENIDTTYRYLRRRQQEADTDAELLLADFGHL